MKRNYLTVLAVLLTMGLSAQQSTDLKSEITQKEKELSEATTLSRSGYNELKIQLQKLYSNYKEELELQINSSNDATIRTAKEKELAELNQKITK